jgi:hypothetical protein
VSPIEILRHDEQGGRIAVEIYLLAARLDPRDPARRQPVPAVQELPLTEKNRLAQTVGFDVRRQFGQLFIVVDVRWASRPLLEFIVVPNAINGRCRRLMPLSERSP